MRTAARVQHVVAPGVVRPLRQTPVARVAQVSRISADAHAGRAQLRTSKHKTHFSAQRRGVIMAVQAPFESKKSSHQAGPRVCTATFRLGNKVAFAPLSIKIKDAEGNEESQEIDVSDWITGTWDRSATGEAEGTILTGQLNLDNVKRPGAAYIKYNGPEPKNEEEAVKQTARVFVNDITLSVHGEEDVVIQARSWVNKYHSDIYGHRVFFKDEAHLPKDTPSGLMHDRKLELAIIQGVDENGEKIAKNPRKPADRIEDYDVYNDLGSADEPRPVLGGKGRFKYPRRLKTNRGLNADQTEKPIKNSAYALPKWIPADDDFNTAKEGAFDATKSFVILPVIVAQLQRAQKRLALPKALGGWVGALIAIVYRVVSFITGTVKGAASGVIGGSWSSFAEVNAIYNDTEGEAVIANNAKIGTGATTPKAAPITDEDREQTYKAVSALPWPEQALILGVCKISWKDWLAPQKVIPEAKYRILEMAVNNNLEWPEPLVMSGRHAGEVHQVSDGTAVHRHDAWSTDEEFGRQYKAGSNPLVLAALRSFPPELAGDAKAKAAIHNYLETHTIEGLISDVNKGKTPRIFMVDYMEPLAKAALEVNGKQKDRCLYAGRCIMYQRDDKKLVPVAIELRYREEKPDGTRIDRHNTYTPADKNIWSLAKAAFNSIDSGVHQLVSHWLRTHACVEPYIIATDRNLSQMHPISKLLQPHLMYTYRINRDARTILVAAGKIVEMVFTPGTYAMQLSADVYAGWRFDEQSFAADVVKRGLGKAGHKRGSVEIIAEDHPWAEDGKLIWDALHTYIADYVKIYYKHDHDVTDDNEIQSWWTEIKTKGHADIEVGWPELKTIEDLIDILATIAWTASAHHAAVNFGQADYSSMPLNRSALFRKPLPEEGTEDYEKLTVKKLGIFEEEFLKYTTNQLSATIVIAVMEILSSHSANEHYLIDSDQQYISGHRAQEVHRNFLNHLQKAEDTINGRNTSGKSAARTPSMGGLPYQLLLPRGIGSLGEPLDTENNPGNERVIGKPGRGIPFSISI